MISLYESLIQNKKEFVIIKPEFLHLKNDIVKFLLKHGFMVKDELRRTMSKEDASRLYSPHKDEPFYGDLVDYMCSGDSIGMNLVNFKGEDLSKVKDEIRKKWGKDEMKNCLHSSDSSTNVNRESKIYFRKKEEV